MGCASPAQSQRIVFPPSVRVCMLCTGTVGTWYSSTIPSVLVCILCTGTGTWYSSTRYDVCVHQYIGTCYAVMADFDLKGTDTCWVTCAVRTMNLKTRIIHPNAQTCRTTAV